MAISYKENQVNGKQRGPDGKLYVIPGGPLDPAAKNNKVEAPKYFEGATAEQQAAFDKGVEFVSAGGGAFQNRMGQYVDASGRATAAPPLVAPKSMDDRASDLLSGQLQDQQKLADELGLDTQYPTTFEGIIQERADAQAREAAQARAELERQKELIIQQAGDVKKSAETQIAGVKSALAQDREGPFSVGNVATQERTTAALKEQIDRAIATQNAALQKVQNIEQAIKDAERQGNRDLVDLYQGQLEAAKFELTQADTALLDAQVSASEEARAVQEATRQNFETFTSFVNEGQTLTVQGIKNLAGQLNIDFESAFDYYQSVENIRVDKSLSQTEKEIALQDAALELDRKMTNRDLEEVRKVDYLTSLYQSGASQEEISAYKQLAGITDENDPVYKLDLQIKQAEAKIKQAEANGEFVSPIDRLEYATKMAELAEKTGGIGVYKPTSSKYDVAATNNGIIISVSDGQKLDNPSTARDEGQCGAFVNDVLGIGVGNTLASKTKFIDESVVVPAAGMAFVSSRGYDLPGGQGNSGHIGIVESVNADGTFNTVEANYNGDGKISRRENVPVTDVIGFIRPEKAEFLGRSGQGSLIKTLDEKTIDNVRSEANSFRQEPIVKDYNTTLNKYQSVQSILDSEIGGPGDLALVFEFMKGLDPTSVVRESEYESAAKSGNIFAGTFARFNGYLKPEGGFLPENVKQDFVAIVKKKLDVTQQQYENLYEQYSKRINNLAGGTQVANELLTDYSQAFNKSKVSTQTDKELLESFYAEEITSEQVGLDSQSLSEIDSIFPK